MEKIQNTYEETRYLKETLSLVEVYVRRDDQLPPGQPGQVLPLVLDLI